MGQRFTASRIGAALREPLSVWLHCTAPYHFASYYTTFQLCQGPYLATYVARISR